MLSLKHSMCPHQSHHQCELSSTNTTISLTTFCPFSKFKQIYFIRMACFNKTANEIMNKFNTKGLWELLYFTMMLLKYIV